MSTIDAAIIKALVEHVGGDSSGIPNGTIGGKTYTEGDGINIVNDQISVEYDSNTMELKDGKLAAKTQLTAGDGLTVSNGKILANLDTNTMQIKNGKITTKPSGTTNPNIVRMEDGLKQSSAQYTSGLAFTNASKAALTIGSYAIVYDEDDICDKMIVITSLPNETGALNLMTLPDLKASSTGYMASMDILCGDNNFKLPDGDARYGLFINNDPCSAIQLLALCTLAKNQTSE